MTRRKNKLEQIGRKCPYCKRVMIAYKADLTIERRGLIATEEHIVPQSIGGTDEPINIMIACARCNNLRGDMPFDAFVEFARTVIQKYPDSPTPILRNLMLFFMMRLVENAVVNKKNLRRASQLTLFKMLTDGKDYV